MTNSTPSRPGQNQLAGDVQALFLDLFGGEVLTAFETKVMLRDKHQVKQLSGGKSFRFPAVWRTNASYHTPGTEILGNQIPHTEIVITPDDKAIAHTFIADIDEVMNHFDIRAPYSKELGEALARLFDANVLRTILLASRGAALFTGDQGGTKLTNAAFATTANTIIDGLSLAKETMDTKDVPVDSMPVYAMLKPTQWYIVARSDKNLNRDFNGGDATIRKMGLTTIDDINVLKSNIASGVYGVDDTANADIPAAYRASYANSIGAVWTPMAACSAMVQDLSFQVDPQVSKQGTLLLSRLMVGTRKLRTKCAVELAVA